MSNELDDLFSEIGQTVLIYIGKEIIADIEENDKTVITYNPIPIQAIVSQIAPEKIYWKKYGFEVTEAKKLVIEDKHLNLIRISQKITIDGVEFYAYRENSQNISIHSVGNGYIEVEVTRFS